MTSATNIATIEDLEKRRYVAMLAGDAAHLDEIFADDLHYMHSDAIADDKSTYIGKIADGSLRYLDIAASDQTIKALGDCVLVYGKLEGDLISGGEPRRLNTRFMAVWRHDGAAWRFQAFAPTPIPKIVS